MLIRSRRRAHTVGWGCMCVHSTAAVQLCPFRRTENLCITIGSSRITWMQTLSSQMKCGVQRDNKSRARVETYHLSTGAEAFASYARCEGMLMWETVMKVLIPVRRFCIPQRVNAHRHNVCNRDMLQAVCVTGGTVDIGSENRCTRPWYTIMVLAQVSEWRKYQIDSWIFQLSVIMKFCQ